MSKLSFGEMFIKTDHESCSVKYYREIFVIYLLQEGWASRGCWQGPAMLSCRGHKDLKERRKGARLRNGTGRGLKTGLRLAESEEP